MTIIYFGEPWDAPVIDDATRLPETPTHAKCLRCHEQFQEGDQGIVTPYIGKCDPEYIVGIQGTGHGQGISLTAMHRGCQLAGIVGHMVGVCTCTGWDIDARATGEEVLRRVAAGALLG